jgi:flavin reductase (DIM6/NTAB) family NADH-FMN oxidoreductase RutF
MFSPIAKVELANTRMNWFDQRPDDAMDGAFTVVGPESVRTCEPSTFREAMSRLWAAVHIITTAGPAGKAGATASAVCSVTDAPPMLLVCLNRRTQTSPILQGNGVFCVNTLAYGDAGIADLFAGRTGVAGPDRFATGDWMTLATGSPVLASAVVAFDCRVIEVRAVGSHNVCFGAVDTVRLGPAGAALMYHERGYKPL